MPLLLVLLRLLLELAGPLHLLAPLQFLRGTALFGRLVRGQRGLCLAEEVADPIELVRDGHGSAAVGQALLEGFLGEDITLSDKLLVILALNEGEHLLGFAESGDRIACLLSASVRQPDRLCCPRVQAES